MAKAIMIQGTMSNAGKSILCAALCRIFKQDGYRVAPFKSQNMALNSYITDEGLEMGRAQVVQAEAAGVAPSVMMNPILLKPVTDMGSQVIVNGEVLGNYRATEYYKMKPKLAGMVKETYDKLAANYDIIVIEGAGSPAEINLKKDDIVNMGMAKMAGAPVLLVGDIDRGGVFAQLYGTVKLLDEDEQEIIKGTIINKFRGDVTLLQDGLRQIEELTDKPVIGVVPMMNVDVDDEDSLSERFHKNNADKPDFIIDVAVIRLPKISNFTDFYGLEAMSKVRVRYISTPDEIGDADLIIIPGTKSTIEDMKWMEKNGLAERIKSEAGRGKHIIGICGGYQMLGKTICDPIGAEHDTNGQYVCEGLGLLDMNTVFEDRKTRTRVEGRISNISTEYAAIEGCSVIGYEIHMGASRGDGSTLDDKDSYIIQLNNGKADGMCSGNVLGTYLHGFFDSDELRMKLLKMLAENKGLDPDSICMDGEFSNLRDYKEHEYNKLADMVRASLDMKKIYEIMGME